MPNHSFDLIVIGGGPAGISGANTGGLGDETGLLKLIFGRDDMRLLGAMMSNSGAELLNRTCFNSPTLGDLYKYATYKAILKTRRMHRRYSGELPPRTVS